MDQLLHPAEVAKLLGVSQTTLTRYRLEGTGPPAVYLSARTIRYRPKEVAQWLETKRKDKEDDHDS